VSELNFPQYLTFAIWHCSILLVIGGSVTVQEYTKRPASAVHGTWMVNAKPSMWSGTGSRGYRYLGYGQEPRPGFTKATVSAWRVALEARGLGSVSINVRITAVRKLAAEAADKNATAGEQLCRRGVAVLVSGKDRHSAVGVKDAG